MTANKPLSYLSLKCVLEHLDPNMRFPLHHKCPSIRSTEKLLPLKLHSLQLSPIEFRVGAANPVFTHGSCDSSYKLRIIRHYPNNNGQGQELFDDVDKYGIQLHNQKIEKEADEVLIGYSYYHDNEELRRHREDGEADDLLEWETELATLEKEQKLRRMYAQTSNGILALEKLEKSIKELKAKILPYHLRRDNAKPPYNHYLQLTITSRGVEQVEHVAYNKRIHEAMRYLIKKLFGGRSLSIEVNKLNMRTYDVLRLPTNLKLKLRTIEVRWDDKKFLDTIKPIIDSASFPLESFITDGRSSLNDPIIQTAQKLILNSSSALRKLPELTHHRVHFRRFSESEIVHTVRHWLQNGRKIGTCFTYSLFLSEDANANSVMKEIERINGARIGEPRDIRRTQCVIFRMSNSSVLCVDCKKVRVPFRDSWRIRELKMEVEPIDRFDL